MSDKKTQITADLLTKQTADFDAPAREELMRVAGDIIGPGKLADLLGMKSRNIYWLMAGNRPVKDGILADTRKILVEHRQKTSALIALIRNEEDQSTGDHGANHGD